MNWKFGRQAGRVGYPGTGGMVSSHMFGFNIRFACSRHYLRCMLSSVRSNRLYVWETRRESLSHHQYTASLAENREALGLGYRSHGRMRPDEMLWRCCTHMIASRLVDRQNPFVATFIKPSIQPIPLHEIDKHYCLSSQIFFVELLRCPIVPKVTPFPHVPNQGNVPRDLTLGNTE